MAKGPVPIRSEEQKLSDAETRVLVPETHTVGVKIGEHVVDLRPLTIKFAKLIAAITDPVALELEELGTSTAKLLELLPNAQDAYTKALCVLGQFYKVPLNSDYIEENLTSIEVRDILEQQLALSRDNDHLLLSLRRILAAATGIVETMKQVTQALATAASSQVSVSAGELASTNSLASTLEAS